MWFLYQLHNARPTRPTVLADVEALTMRLMLKVRTGWQMGLEHMDHHGHLCEATQNANAWEIWGPP